MKLGSEEEKEGEEEGDEPCPTWDMKKGTGGTR